MWVKKFAEFALSGTAFEIQAFLCFAIFCEKMRKFKMAAIFGGTKSFVNWVNYTAVTLRIKIFVEIALSSTVSEIQAFLCFAFFFVCVCVKCITCRSTKSQVMVTYQKMAYIKTYTLFKSSLILYLLGPWWQSGNSLASHL